tara:strand:+ start:492 stop:851 length:360 start_codon:yes stop_codon:yes gene_type:complete
MNNNKLSIKNILGLPILDLLHSCNDKDLIKLYHDTEQHMLDIIDTAEYNNDIIVECISLINKITGKNISSDSHKFTNDYLCECFGQSDEPRVISECLRGNIIRILLLGIELQHPHDYED